MPTVDLAFAVVGKEIPVDHGYALYAAISRVLPEVHANRAVGIHPIRGPLLGNRLMGLGPGSRLTVRIPAENIAAFLPLAGKRLEIDGHAMSVGVPTVYALCPAAALRSRLVIIKGFMDADGFLAAAQRQLDQLQARGRLSLGVRRTMGIKDKEVVGYAVAVSELTADESLDLQEQGIGGRRRFGCGVFVPRLKG